MTYLGLIGKKFPVITIDQSKCTVPFLCKKCLQACPQAVLTVHHAWGKEEKLKESDPRIDGNYVLSVGRRDKCNVCNRCIDVCPVDAFNVETRVKGRNPSLPPVVVMTPRSGWYHCVSERGGGIACWLEMIRRLSENRPNRDVWFVASTGHELGHVGLDHFLDQHPSLVKDAHIWIHLGANFAAAKSPAVHLQSSEKALEALALKAMGKENVRPATIMPPGRRPWGEARNIYDGQGRYISLLGLNGLFHHIDDRWPESVDMKTTVRLVDAFIDIIQHVAR